MFDTGQVSLPKQQSWFHTCVKFLNIDCSHPRRPNPQNSLIISSTTIVKSWSDSERPFFTQVFEWNGCLILPLWRSECSESSYIAVIIIVLPLEVLLFFLMLSISQFVLFVTDFLFWCCQCSLHLCVSASTFISIASLRSDLLVPTALTIGKSNDYLKQFFHVVLTLVR